MRRLEHWLHVLPAVEGADIKLMNPTEARQLCTAVDMPAAASPPSHPDDIQGADSADAGHPVTENVFEATTLQQSCDDSGEIPLPDFPLLPVSRGFEMKLQKLLSQFDAALTAAGITTSLCSGSAS